MQPFISVAKNFLLLSTLSATDLTSMNVSLGMADTLDKEEVFEFLGSIGIEQVKLFTNFFNTMPYVQTQKQITCGKCGFEHTIVVQGINDFFG
jgi:hypothetical protein